MSQVMSQSEVKALASKIIGDGESPNQWFVTESVNSLEVNNEGDMDCVPLPGFELKESYTYGPFSSLKVAMMQYNELELSAGYGIGEVCIEDRQIGVVMSKTLEKRIRVEYVETEYDDTNLYEK